MLAAESFPTESPAQMSSPLDRVEVPRAVENASPELSGALTGKYPPPAGPHSFPLDPLPTPTYKSAMMSTHWRPQLISIAEEASALALSFYRKTTFSLKPDQSLVTEADLSIEKLLKERLGSLLPEARFIGEESRDHPREIERARASEFVWVVDPIDGTTVFVDAVGTFTICIGLLRNGQPYAGVMALPALGRIFTSIRGDGAFEDEMRLRVRNEWPESNRTALYVGSRAHQEYDLRFPGKTRSLGSTALHYLLVARGVAVGALSTGHLWDYAAAAAILTEAGGTLRHLDGQEINWTQLYDGRNASPPILGAPPELWDEVATSIRWSGDATPSSSEAPDPSFELPIGSPVPLPEPDLDKIRVSYGITCPPSEIEQRSREMVFEQCVEVPESLVPLSILEKFLGEVVDITPRREAPTRFTVTVDYPSFLSCDQLSQLLNLIYGNVSIQPGIRVEGLELPSSLLQEFPGPRHGIEGVREILGIRHRPLLATALKPRGSSPQEFARIAGDFARGGGDLIKDDHNLVERDPRDFEERVKRCRDAVLSSRDGNPQTLYLPNVSAASSDLEARLAFLRDEGIRGVLLAPFLIGLDRTRGLLADFDLIAVAHPSFSGPYLQDPNHGVSHGVLLGTLMRLIGFDASVFPNHGGRFSFLPRECQSICDRLLSPLGTLKSAFPAPAGGMNFERLGDMTREYGREAILLIGGALLAHSTDLEESTRAFVSEIERLSSN